MTIVQITPGAGAMYCGNCFRDNALVAALRRTGHDVTMVPLYLPLTRDEEDRSASTPVFFGGINVYLEQKSSFIQRMPGFLHRLLASRRLLRWAAGRAASTRAAEVGDMLLSMLRGEEGRQARELDELVVWLKQHHPPQVFDLDFVHPDEGVWDHLEHYVALGHCHRHLRAGGCGDRDDRKRDPAL